MDLTKLVKTTLKISGVILLSGCAVGEYIGTETAQNSKKKTTLYDKNNDSRLDKLVVSQRDFGSKKIYTLTLEDSNFDGQVDKISYKIKHMTDTPEHSTQTLIDGDHNGIYEKAVVEKKERAGKTHIIFLDRNQDGTFDEVSCRESANWLNFFETKESDYLKRFNTDAKKLIKKAEEFLE